MVDSGAARLLRSAWCFYVKSADNHPPFIDIVIANSEISQSIGRRNGSEKIAFFRHKREIEVAAGRHHDTSRLLRISIDELQKRGGRRLAGALQHDVSMDRVQLA